MAARSRGIWGIDLGNNCLKAIHLRVAGDAVEVIGFDNIEYSKVLSGGNVSAEEKKEIIGGAFRQFVERNPVGKEEVVISIPGQSSFARFIKLPPVEPKRIPEIVRFEAVQQIPFDINEVEWDWQLMQKSDSPEAEVGIFAVKNELISSVLDYFGKENLTVTGVQMAPIAIYNYIIYDRADIGDSDAKAVVVLDMGSDTTDLVVCTRSTVWQRCIPIGGNTFTKAIAETFKLDFEKAEKLKRTAAVSKYAKQIFQAMKPVFTDLAAEIQRSLGFYSSSNRNVKLTKVLALGGGMKLQGLVKFMQQTLQTPIIRPDSFEKLKVSSEVSEAKFHENVADFGVIYGLALQGLGLAKMQNNLLPRRLARSMSWSRKSKMFTIAASILLFVSLAGFAKMYISQSRYNSNEAVRNRIKSVISAADKAKRGLADAKAKETQYEEIISKQSDLFKNRDAVPSLLQKVISRLPASSNNSEQESLYKAFAAGKAEEIMKTPRYERKQIFVTSVSISYADDLEKASLPVTSSDSASKIAVRPEAAAMAEVFASKRGGTKEKESSKGEKAAGFVVLLEGYSPYKSILGILDPVGAGEDESKWGFVTRLMNLSKNEPNGPFELYKKTDVKHFVIETGDVEYGNAVMPAGIGVEQIKVVSSQQSSAPAGRYVPRGPVAAAATTQSIRIIIDPMTKETISKVAVLDAKGSPKLDTFGNPVFEINDHWFRIKAKFAWKDAVKLEGLGGAGGRAAPVETEPAVFME